MAIFTMELKDVIEAVFNPSFDALDWEQPYKPMEYKGIKYGKLPYVDDYEKIGLGTYPIFDEDYRQILNGKIIDEYYVREIGVETIDMFTLFLRRKLDQIMPYYNQMYETLDLVDDFISTIDIHTDRSDSVEGEETTNANTNTNGNNSSQSRAVNSETPQTMLAGNGDYATSAADSKSSSTVFSEGETDTTASNSTVSTGNSRTSGYQGSPADLLAKARSSFINIDTSILRDLEDCFMQVLNSGDSYSSQNWIF